MIGTHVVSRDCLKIKILQKISDALEEESGKTIGENELISIIKDTRSKNIEAAGLVPICATKNPSRTSVNNYKCVLASQASVSITKTAISKTNNRYTAEKSLIFAMAFLIVVANTYFILANEENDEIRKEMKDAPKCIKMLYDMVSKAHGNLPVIPIKTQYIYSSDDTVMYVFEGKGKDKDVFRLVSSKALKHAGTNSKYQSDDSNMMNGMRVKLTFTISAIGTCAPIFISVCGLTPKELPKEACIIVQVEGLCIGGGTSFKILIILVISFNYIKYNEDSNINFYDT